MIDIEKGASIGFYTMEDFADSPQLIDYGAILFCRGGSAELHVSFDVWHIQQGCVITLFPNDIIRLSHVSSDFKAEVVAYSADILREASLQIEESIYHAMRSDRMVKNEIVVKEVVDSVFRLLRFYYSEGDSKFFNTIIALQLKTFFIGFNNFIKREKPAIAFKEQTQRTNELFNRFMELLENNYKESHEVSYYANLLCITPKYLGIIVGRRTGHSTKTIISEYIILQIKLLLRSSHITIKQLAADFHFSDVSFFTRYFKSHTGMTPQQYRKAQK